MLITVNGESRTLPQGGTVEQLLESLHLAGRRVVVQRNGEIVPRSQHAATALVEGDELLVVTAIGGG